MTETTNKHEPCKKMDPNENIIAYMENRQLLRNIPPLTCDTRLVEKLISNYIIVKKIIANLSWQDQILSKSVCRMWQNAVVTLQKELFSPNEFVCYQTPKMKQIVYIKSNEYCVEPLAVFIFINDNMYNNMFYCKDILPSLCTSNCQYSHNILDMMYYSVCFPKKCMLAVKCNQLVFMPRPQSRAYKCTIRRNTFSKRLPFLGGLYIPKIPNVELNLINVKSTSTENLEEFYLEVNKLCETRYIKAVLVFVTDKYLFHSENDILFLNHFKKIQKDMPYAFGGCIIDDTLHDPKDLSALVAGVNEERPFVTEDAISIAIFSIAKNTTEDNGSKNKFEAYSLVIKSSDWSKIRIQKTVNEFSEKVPRFEYSAALKLSCVGRDLRHEAEQDLFRAAFPDTPLAGCYGNGELGHNHPPRHDQLDLNDTAKRYKKDPAVQGILYSYSSVFVYFGWGKMVSK